jgi:hypothetical protein
MAVDLGNAWCADSDGSGNFSNWVRTTDPTQCDANALSWYLLPRADAIALVNAANASSGGTTSDTTFTAQEVAALKYQAANPSPWALSLGDGALVASAVLGCWVLAVCIREIARAFSSGDSSE